MAVLSIILTAPTGAILINTLGTRWLSDDTPKEGDEEVGKGSGNAEGAPKVEDVPDDTIHTARKLIDNNGNPNEKGSIYKVNDINGSAEIIQENGVKEEENGVKEE